MLLFSCSVVSDSATPWTAAGTVLIARDVGSSMWGQVPSSGCYSHFNSSTLVNLWIGL